MTIEEKLCQCRSEIKVFLPPKYYELLFNLSNLNIKLTELFLECISFPIKGGPQT